MSTIKCPLTYLMTSVNSRSHQGEWDAYTDFTTAQCRPKSWTFQFSNLDWVRAARTRAPSATNYDVYASRGKILESPGPKCNGASSSKLSTFWIMDAPRPGKWDADLHRRALFSLSSSIPSDRMGFLLSLSILASEHEINRVERFCTSLETITSVDRSPWHSTNMQMVLMLVCEQK